MIPLTCTKCTLNIYNSNVPIQPLNDINKSKVFIILSEIKKIDMEKKKITINKSMAKLIQDLTIVGFTEKDIYWTNITKCKAPFNTTINDLKVCAEYIQEEIQQFKHGIILVIGITACRVFFNETFNPYNILGKVIINNNKSKAIIAIPGLKNVYQDENNLTNFRNSLIKAFKFYKDNIDFSHDSPYRNGCTNKCP